MRKKINVNWHLVLLAVIIILFSTSVVILIKWNIGTKSQYDPTVINPDFDVEAMDMIIPMNPAGLAGREDDGVTTILCLGNNPFSDELGDQGLAARIAAKTGATVYNGAFPDSVVVCKYPVYQPEYPKDHFNLYYVTQALINKEFAGMISTAGQEADKTYLTAAKELEQVDMEKVDMLVIMYDTTDYNTLSPADNPNNPYDVTAFTGALRTSIENIQKAFPHIRIILMSHSYAQYRDEKGKLHNGTITDLGNGNVPHYLIMESNVALDCGISFIDHYFGTIHEENYKEYMRDHMRYNDAGREAIAQRFADAIQKK